MCIGVFSGCNIEELTEEQHIERISVRVQERFFAEDSRYCGLYTDFKVEILYDFGEEPAFFMVEFEPSGFLYGTIHRNNYYFTTTDFYKGGQCIGYCPGQHGWDVGSIRHYRSHFDILGFNDERKYLAVGGFLVKSPRFPSEPFIKKEEGVFIRILSDFEQYREIILDVDKLREPESFRERERERARGRGSRL